MRFGHTLHRLFVPEWSEQYIDYNLLKCLIKLSKLSEAYQCLDSSISSLEGFLRGRLNSPNTDPKKLQWFQEINARAVWRILAKLERHGQSEDPSHGRLRVRWQTLQSALETQLASVGDNKQIVAEDVIKSSNNAILVAGQDGFTPLHLAVIGGHAQLVSHMIDSLPANRETHARNVVGEVLHVALRYQNDAIICSLLRGCADLSYRSSRDETALHVAVQVGRADYAALVLEAMLKQGASHDVPDNSRAWTPLLFACADGNSEIVQLLIRAGSNQKHQDRLGWTAKEVAAFRGHLAVADLLEPFEAFLTGGPADPVENQKARVGNSYYGADQNVIIATLGTTAKDRPIAGLDLPYCSPGYTQGKYKAGSFLLEVSAPGASERRRVPLPVLDDQINNPFVFTVPDSTDPRLVFDVIQVTCTPRKEVVVASGTALLAGNSRQFGAYRQSLVREQTIPILERETMHMAGSVTFTPLIVRPFSHLQIPRHINLARSPSGPPVLIGHRGAGQNTATREHLQVGENTVGSFLSAVKLGASFVEFDIQITRDLQAVTFHDLSLSESGTDVPIHDVTLDQFLHASNTQSPHGNPLSMIGAGHSRDEAGKRPRSRSLGREFEAGAAQIRDRMKHTVDFKEKGFKPNTRGDFIQDAFATLQEILVALPKDIGCDIEIKYPRLHETVAAGVAPIAIELNTFVNVVLEQLHQHADNRQIILSSFTPEICILLALKQKAYPVFFITNAGKVPMTDMEVRAASLQGAVHFAERWGLAGVVFACETLVMCPRLVGLVKGKGLVCGTYGAPNNDPGMVEVSWLISFLREALLLVALLWWLTKLFE
ncbi:Glycerophosphoryl diester phosphodiesterase family domain containing protein [Rhypophila sp. PSN 637]